MRVFLYTVRRIAYCDTRYIGGAPFSTRGVRSSPTFRAGRFNMLSCGTTRVGPIEVACSDPPIRRPPPAWNAGERAGSSTIIKTGRALYNSQSTPAYVCLSLIRQRGRQAPVCVLQMFMAAFAASYAIPVFCHIRRLWLAAGTEQVFSRTVLGFSPWTFAARVIENSSCSWERRRLAAIVCVLWWSRGPVSMVCESRVTTGASTAHAPRFPDLRVTMASMMHLPQFLCVLSAPPVLGCRRALLDRVISRLDRKHRACSVGIVTDRASRRPLRNLRSRYHPKRLSGALRLGIRPRRPESRADWGCAVHSV